MAKRSAHMREYLTLALLVLLFIGKGVVWSIALPLWQGPDEDDHYAVIQFIAEMGRLPDDGDEVLPDEVALSRDIADVGRLNYAPDQRQSFTDGVNGPNEAQFTEIVALSASYDRGDVGKLMHATPLYYVLAAIPYQLTADATLLTRAAVQRIVSIILSSPIVILAYVIVREIRPKDPTLAITVAILVAFQPMLTEVTAVVSVDGFFFVLYSLAIYLGLRTLKQGFTRTNALAMAVVFATGVLVKPTMNGFAPLIALLVLLDFIRRPQARRTIIINGLLAAVIVALPVGWWIQRSLRLNQDLFYFNPVLKGHRIITNPLYDYPFWQHAVDYWRSVWGGIFVTWWAHFGWLDTALPGWVYNVLRWLTVLAIVGLGVGLWRSPVWDSGWRDFGRKLAPYLLFALTIIFPIILLQYYDLQFWHTYGVGRGLQGRYWLGTIIPMLFLFALGLRQLVPSWHQANVDIALRIGMIVLNFVSLIGYILPRYYI